MTVSSVAIPSIIFCDESCLVLSHLILYTGQGHTAAHYPHVAISLRVSGVSVSIYCMYVYIYIYIYIYMSIYTGII